MERFSEYRSATPEQIRVDLGLDLDASEAEVVSARWRLLEAIQRNLGLVDARSERVADRTVSEYGDGATELTTQQTQPETEEQTATQFGSQLRQEGTE